MFSTNFQKFSTRTGYVPNAKTNLYFAKVEPKRRIEKLKPYKENIQILEKYHENVRESMSWSDNSKFGTEKSQHTTKRTAYPK